MTFRRVQAVLAQLESGEIDGVVAVGMLGEGIDMPRFKIAALHAPHKSLGATLQFIGRLARTGGEAIGAATFIAAPGEVEGDLRDLYESDSTWSDLVPTLADTRVEEERETRNALRTFHISKQPDVTLERLSLYSIRPFHHVKVYRTTDLDLHSLDIALPGKREVVYRLDSEPLSCIVLVGRTVGRPRWSESGVIIDTLHDLVVLYWSRPHGLLFVGATVKSAPFYDAVVKELGVAVDSRLRSFENGRVLRRLAAPQFISLGMRSRIPSRTVETYRIAAGPETQRSLTTSSARVFERGHATARGRTPQGRLETLGVSSSSKVWSNTASQVPSFLRWCDSLAVEISNSDPVRTNTEYDLLPEKQRVARLPSTVIGAFWSQETYLHGRTLEFTDADGVVEEIPLEECELVVRAGSANDEAILFAVENGGRSWPIESRLSQSPMFVVDPPVSDRLSVVVEDERVSLADYLQAEPPFFLLANLTTVSGDEAAPRGGSPIPAFERSTFRVIDWAAGGVDIEVEVGVGSNGRVSVQSWVEGDLRADTFDVVLHDHGQGEIADFVCLRRSANGAVEITLVHCKGSTEARSGARVADIQEVAAQAIRSVPRLLDAQGLAEAIRRRVRRQSPSRFVTGTAADLEALLVTFDSAPPSLRVCVVQPGLSAADASPGVLELLGAADCHARDHGCAPIAVWVSA